MPSFSKARCFNEQNIKQYATESPGVYEVGISRSGRFKPCYVGESGNLEERLLQHFKGDGNEEIKNYMSTFGINSLHFRNKKTKDRNEARCIESSLLLEGNSGPVKKYEWNKQLEYDVCSSQCKPSKSSKVGKIYSSRKNSRR